MHNYFNQYFSEFNEVYLESIHLSSCPLIVIPLLEVQLSVRLAHERLLICQKRSSVYPPLPPPICPFICFYSQLASFTNPLFHFNNRCSSHHLIPRSSPP